MADLTTTITESVTLNGAIRGTTNTITTTGIVDVFERILTCTHSQTTTIATFASTPHASAGALDVENAKYIRITNLDSTNFVTLYLIDTDTEGVMFKLDADKKAPKTKTNLYNYLVKNNYYKGIWNTTRATEKRNEVK